MGKVDLPCSSTSSLHQHSPLGLHSKSSFGMSFRLGNMDCIPFLIWYTQFFFISILGLISKLISVEALCYQAWFWLRCSALKYSNISLSSALCRLYTTTETINQNIICVIIVLSSLIGLLHKLTVLLDLLSRLV